MPRTAPTRRGKPSGIPAPNYDSLEKPMTIDDDDTDQMDFSSSSSSEDELNPRKQRQQPVRKPAPSRRSFERRGPPPPPVANGREMPGISASAGPGTKQLHELAAKLAALSELLNEALRVAPPEVVEDLAERIDNDWALEEMQTMVEGVIAVYKKGGYNKWMSGERWSKSKKTRSHGR